MTTAVAIALYNGERFIEEQLDSLRNQSQKIDQVVLCDDCSRDGTFEKVTNYIQKYELQNCWKLYKNPQNLGYVKNFYRAISLCDTDLVFLCDQDDIWREDKIEKMASLLEQNAHISLLSCKYGIIDADGNPQHSIVEKSGKEDEQVLPVTVEDIIRAYRWPGMIMCVRKSFFEQIYPAIKDSPAAHDLVLAMLAADSNAFYDYNYIGAYHRRHGNNTAREEHRIFKLLNLQRKLTDIAVTKKLWNQLLDAKLPLRDQTIAIIRERLALLIDREEALRAKSLLKVIRVYKKDGGRLLRLNSFVCDVWLSCFGKLPQ